MQRQLEERIRILLGEVRRVLPAARDQMPAMLQDYPEKVILECDRIMKTCWRCGYGYQSIQAAEDCDCLSTTVRMRAGMEVSSTHE